MKASQVGTYLSLPKSLIGTPVWLPGNRQDSWTLSWPILCDGIGQGPKIIVDHSASAPFLTYSILLVVPPSIERLDICETLEHVVKRKGRAPKTVRGHHYHRWSNNIWAVRGDSIPRQLLDCDPYEGPIDFVPAFCWFCDRVGITVSLDIVPSLPKRSTLL